MMGLDPYVWLAVGAMTVFAVVLATVAHVISK